MQLYFSERIIKFVDVILYNITYTYSVWEISEEHENTIPLHIGWNIFYIVLLILEISYFQFEIIFPPQSLSIMQLKSRFTLILKHFNQTEMCVTFIWNIWF